MKSLTSTFYRWRRRLLTFAILMGPGIIAAFADNDAAGVATYSVAASQFGYAMLITLVPITLVLAVTQEIGARMAIVAQKGLGDLVRERYGVRVAMGVFLLLIVINGAVILQDIGGLRAGLELLGLNPTLFVPIIIFLIFMFMVRSNYAKIEKFFLVLIGFYAAYVISAILAKPDWNLATRSLFLPSKTAFSFSYLFTAVAVLGTTVTAWGQFFINSYVKDKNIDVGHLRYSQVEVYLGAIVTNLFSFFMMVAVAATLFPHGIVARSAAEAAVAIQPFAGQFAGILFGAGLVVAGILGTIIVPLSTAYAFAEFFGFEGSLDVSFQKSREFYVLILVQLTLGTALALIPSVSLFQITLLANFANGLALPVIFFFLYRFANTESVMGERKNGKLQNVLLIGAGIVITIAAIIGGLGRLWGR